MGFDNTNSGNEHRYSNEDDAICKGTKQFQRLPYRGGAAQATACPVEKSKGLGLPLDGRDKDDKTQASTPHDLILRYLPIAEIVSDSRG